MICLLLLLLWGANPALAEGFLCAGSQGTPTEATLPSDVAAKPTRITQSSTTGTRRALVLFARFNGEPANPVPSWAADLFNPDLPGSFSHFYDTMSFGKLKIRGEVGPRVYESSQPASAYLAGDPTAQGRFGQFSQEILEQADQDLDFARFDDDGPDGIPASGDDDGVVDVVFLVTASTPRYFLFGGATGVADLGLEEDFHTDDLGARGQQVWISASQGTIQRGRSFAEATGSMCHEYGHVLGLPDLFNTAYVRHPDLPPEEDSAGSGAWCLMGWGALGWHGDDGPNSFCAWSRAKLGWTPVAQTSQEEQEVRLEEVGRGGAVFKVPLKQDEYFLLEHRRRGGTYYDRNLPGEGLLIWHVHERQEVFWEADSSRADSPGTTVDLECADGRWLDAGYPQGRQADPLRGGDNLDFWAHDAQYSAQHRGNTGDATDPFDGVRYTAFTPQTNPPAHSEDGQLSVRIEDIRPEGGAILAKVEAQVPLIRVAEFSLVDEDKDSVVVAGEEVTVNFSLKHEGSFAAGGVRVQLHSLDPWVEILQSEVSFGDLAVGAERPYRGRDHLRWQFADRFVNAHTAELSLNVYAGEDLVGGRELAVTGFSPRQAIRQVAVSDSLGNGDGQPQRGEIIGLEIRLAQEIPGPLLQRVQFTLWPLQEYARLISSPLVRFGAQRLMPQFLLSAQAPAADSLRFELVADARFSTWRDTLRLAPLPAEPDRFPPRVGRLYTRSLDQGLALCLNGEEVLDGSPIDAVEALVYSAADTALLTRLPLEWNTSRYEGVWQHPGPGNYLLEARVVDQAGNQGRSALQRLVVKGRTGVAGEGADTSGGSWAAEPLPPAGWRPFLSGLAIAPADPRVLYLRAWHGLWRSRDEGLSWEQVARLPDGAPLNEMGMLGVGSQLLVDAQDPLTVYTSMSLGRPVQSLDNRYQWLRSQDGGRNWEPLDKTAEVLAVDPLRSGVLYGRRRGVLAISADGGRSWQQTKVSMGGTRAFVQAHPATPQVVYAGSYTGTLGTAVGIDRFSYTADGGQTWAQQKLGKTYGALLPDPAEPAGLYASSRDTLWHSADQGATWQKVAQGFSETGHPQLHFLAHPRIPGSFLAWNTWAVWQSMDGGKTWLKGELPASINEGFYQFVLHPGEGREFFLVVADFGTQAVYRTRDSGQHWQQLGLPVATPPVGILGADPAGQLYAGAVRAAAPAAPSPQLYISPAGERDWQVVEGEEIRSAYLGTYSALGTTEALWVEPSDPRIVLAYLSNWLWRSADGGRTWAGVYLEGDPQVGFSNDCAEIAGFPNQPGVYYLADSRGLFRSVNFGQTWGQCRGGLPLRPSSFFTSYHLALDPLRPGTLYASTGDHRLWRSRDGGGNWELAAALNPGQYIHGLAVLPVQPQRLLAAAHNRLYATDDEGKHWTALLASRDYWDVVMVRLRLDPFDPNHLFLVTGPQLLESRDLGQTWASIGAGSAPFPWFHDVAVDPGDGEGVYAATPWGVYRLDRRAQVTAVEGEEELPATFSLSPNFPNPFNPTTTLRFSLPQPGEAELAIYNLLGQRVATLVHGMQEAGPQVLQWNGRDDAGRELASGVYLYRLQAGSQVETRKLLLLR